MAECRPVVPFDKDNETWRTAIVSAQTSCAAVCWIGTRIPDTNVTCDIRLRQERACSGAGQGGHHHACCTASRMWEIIVTEM